jgi:hypothetical protein
MLHLVAFTFLQSLQAGKFHAKPYFSCEWNIESVAVVHPTDCGENDGSIQIVVNGITDTTNLEYTIDGGVSWQSQNIFLNLPAGAFGVGVRNSDGTCPSFFPGPVELFGPDSPRFIEVEAIDPTDCSINDGTIIITAEGGTGPYFYSIDAGATWTNNNQFFSLCLEFIIRW